MVRRTRPSFSASSQSYRYRPVPDVERQDTGTWYAETMQAKAGACERPAQPVEDYERVRAYEIAAYLAAASYPFDVVPGPPPEPIPSSDLTLNSLVQHGVYKMDAERAFLSLIDNRSQFICAEMTKHQPLAAQSTTQPLLLGVTSIALEWGVCPYTMSVFSGKPVAIPETPYIVADPSYFYIKDLRQIPSFATRPYVTGYPAMVSYIEVPLRSISGHIIGSYCVVDDRLRDFLDPQALDTMFEVTSAISSYLNMKRVDADRTRSERMMDGLRQFIGSERNTYSRTRSAEVSRDVLGPFDLKIFNRTSQHDWSGGVEINGKNEHSLEAGNGGHHLPRLDQERQQPLDSHTKLDSQNPSTGPVVSAPTSSSATTTTDASRPHSSEVDENDSFSTAEHQDTSESRIPDMTAQIKLFAKAADMIGHAMDLDGLTFFGAASNGASYTNDFSTQHPVQVERSQSIAGKSVTMAEPLYEYRRKNRANASTTVQLSQSLLKHLTIAYPQGYVFAVDEYGVLNYDTNEATEVAGSPILHEWDELFKCVPGSRYLIFLPLWHYQRESCFATCLAWVTETGKTLTYSDVTSLTGFGNSLMSEILRLEALTNTQSKSDFVSSISHELRSPLHGILATVELMQESVTDPELLSLVKMIESCSTTLLDTFNHLLDFTKINSRAVDGRQADNNTMCSGPISEDISEDPVDLGVLIEDVLGAVALGHTNAKDMEHGLDREQRTMANCDVQDFPQEKVMITTYIESDLSWILPIDKGAWKRILLNVCSNALKYTTAGYIDVGLSLLPSTECTRPHICLSVADTGIGMSPEFLKYHLFTPFMQENNLSPGTGLGLSLVKSIVESLRGQVSVESKVGEGTRVTIKVPLQREPSKPQLASCGNMISAQRKLQGLSLGFLTLGSTDATANARARIVVPKTGMWRSIRNICEDGFGMIVKDLGVDATLDADMILIDALEFVPTDMFDIERLFSTFATSKRPIAVLTLGNQVQGLDRIFGAKGAMCMASPITRERLCAALTTALVRARPEGPFSQHSQEDPPNLDVHLRALALRSSLTQSDCTLVKKAAASHPLRDRSNHKAPSVEVMAPKDSSHFASSDTGEALSSHHTAAPNKRCRFNRFLLVDDNPINLKVLSAFARRLGVPFSLATNGAEAVTLHKQAILQEENPFDCCFMDLSMPVLDGFQAVSAIRQFEHEQKCDRIHILALTGLGSEVARSTAKASGCDGYLLKPVKFRDIEPLLMG
ncbi:hypothetical protein BDU57DRAFT_510125, partial [Ampelomyces quisqualis]